MYLHTSGNRDFLLWAFGNVPAQIPTVGIKLFSCVLTNRLRTLTVLRFMYLSTANLSKLFSKQNRSSLNFDVTFIEIVRMHAHSRWAEEYMVTLNNF